MAAVIGRCKLCHREGIDLQNSHFLPAGGYKAIQKSMDRAPVVVNPDITIKKNEQTKDYLLCADCEQRFSRNGEAWILAHCNQPERGFRLKEIIDGVAPIGRTDSMSFYSAANTQIDIEKMTYFVSSIMWRGSAHQWHSGNHRVQSPNLGPYEDDLRRYLLGETGFPENMALWISVITDPKLWVTMIVPYGEKLAGQAYWRYKFVFHGLTFMFFVGRTIDPLIRRSCSYRSPEQFIFMGDNLNDMIISDFGKVILKSRPVGSLKPSVVA